MRTFSLILLVWVAGCGPESDTPRPEPPAAETSSAARSAAVAVEVDDLQSIEVLQQQAAKLRRNHKGLVIDVDFRGTSLDLTGLEALAGLPRIRAVRLAGTSISDQ